MIKFDKSLIFYKLPPVLYAVAIIMVSTLSSAAPPKLGIYWADKFYHFLEYFIFGLLIFRSFPSVHQSPKRGIYYTLLFVFGLVYGAIDERVQYYIPRRDSSPYDWIADALGYLLAGVVFLLVRHWWLRRKLLIVAAEKKTDRVGA